MLIDKNKCEILKCEIFMMNPVSYSSISAKLIIEQDNKILSFFVYFPSLSDNVPYLRLETCQREAR